MEDCVYQHMIRNEDWSYKDFFEFAHFIRLSERRFRLILEQVVHPEVRTGDEQERFITAINAHLLKDGFELLAVDQTSGYLVYRVVRKPRARYAWPYRRGTLPGDLLREMCRKPFSATCSK